MQVPVVCMYLHCSLLAAGLGLEPCRPTAAEHRAVCPLRGWAAVSDGVCCQHTWHSAHTKRALSADAHTWHGIVRGLAAAIVPQGASKHMHWDGDAGQWVCLLCLSGWGHIARSRVQPCCCAGWLYILLWYLLLSPSGGLLETWCLMMVSDCPLQSARTAAADGRGVWYCLLSSS